MNNNMNNIVEEDKCDFCDKQKHHLVKRDAGYDEWTCKDCYKEQYEEEDVCETCDPLNKGYKRCMNEFEDNEEVWCEECKYLKSVWS